MTNLFKSLFRRALSPALQQRLRRLYLTREIAKNTGEGEFELGVVLRFIQPGDQVLDVGANVGTYTVALSSLVGAQGQVYSFEPVAANFEILESVRRKMNLTNVRLFRAAVGSRSGETRMVVPDRKDFTGYYQAHIAKPMDEGGQSERVTVHALDGLRQQGILQHVDFMKCDVEGSELEVLRGSENLIKSLKPALLIEVSRETSNEVFRFLQDLNYRAFVLAGSLTETETYRDGEFSNYFFFSEDWPHWRRVLPLIGKEQANGIDAPHHRPGA